MESIEIQDIIVEHSQRKSFQDAISRILDRFENIEGYNDKQTKTKQLRALERIVLKNIKEKKISVEEAVKMLDMLSHNADLKFLIKFFGI